MRSEIGISVRDALGLPVFKYTRVVGGSKGLSNVITNVNVMEVPDIQEWVREGDFLLTTGYSIKDNEELQARLIPSLVEKRASALGIKPKRYLKEIPETMIKLADEYALPILEIPFELSFSDVMTAVMREIVTRQSTVLIESEKAHRRLMNVVLAGGGIVNILNVTSEIIGQPVCVKDSLFNRYFFSHSWLAMELPSTLEEADNDYYHRLPIASGDNVYGYICIYKESKRLTSFDIRISEISSMMVALELVKEQAISEVELRYEFEFVSDLISADSKRLPLTLEKAGVFGLSVNSDYVVVVFSFGGSDGIPNGDINYICKIKNKFVSIGRDVLAKYGRRAVFTVMGSRLIMIVNLGERVMGKASLKDIFTPIIESMFSRFGRMFLNRVFIAGVGNVYDGLGDVWKSYKEACVAEFIGARLGNGSVAFYEDIGFYGLLFKSGSMEEFLEFRDKMLGKLLRTGTRERQKEMIDTLDMFFKCNRNAREVSKKMFLHYNTVVYRLRKIESVLGVDLGNSVDALNLELAIRIHRILKD